MRRTSPDVGDRHLVAGPAQRRAIEEARAHRAAPDARRRAARLRRRGASNSRAAATADGRCRSPRRAGRPPIRAPGGRLGRGGARRRCSAAADPRRCGRGEARSGAAARAPDRGSCPRSARRSRRGAAGSRAATASPIRPRLDARPPRRLGRRAIRLGRADDQALARPRHRDVEAVQLLALGAPRLGREHGLAATAAQSVSE